MPLQWPAFDLAPRDIPRPDHHIDLPLAAAIHPLEQGRQIARMMAEVGIHVDDEFILMIEGILQPGDDGCAEAKLPRAMDAANPWIACCLGVAPLPRTVRAAVVDAHQVALWRVLEDRRHEPGQVLDFVVSRDRYKRLVSHKRFSRGSRFALLRAEF